MSENSTVTHRAFPIVDNTGTIRLLTAAAALTNTFHGPFLHSPTTTCGTLKEQKIRHKFSRNPY
jgi:hypothetical protein